MSKYTTEVRYIVETLCELDYSRGYNNVNALITRALPLIFDFSFPIFDPAYKDILERKIIKHYYTREIGEETFGLWKLRLDTKLNEIMPYYNKLYESELLEFNPLYTDNLTRTRKTNLDSKRTEDENIKDSTTKNRNNTDKTLLEVQFNDTSDVSNTTTNTSNNTDLYSDTPQGAITGLSSNTYLTNARIVNDNNSTSNTGTSETEQTSSSESNKTFTESSSDTYARVRGNNDNLLSTEDYLETVVGYSGSNASDMLMKYRNTFLNIDTMVIKELEDLFLNLW